MGTNVFCEHCGTEVAKDDSFVVDTPEIVRAYHFRCGSEISSALERALRDARGGEDPVVPEMWEFRDLKERMDAQEEMTRRIKSVWALWLNDAEKGCINQGTFDAMKNLLGMR